MSEKPKPGEWWMCRFKDYHFNQHGKAPLLRAENGWKWSGTDEAKTDLYIDAQPLYKMEKAK